MKWCAIPPMPSNPSLPKAPLRPWRNLIVAPEVSKKRKNENIRGVVCCPPGCHRGRGGPIHRSVEECDRACGWHAREDGQVGSTQTCLPRVEVQRGAVHSASIQCSARNSQRD